MFSEGKSDPYTFILDPHVWMDAQGYCRQHHTDLAIIRTTAENQLVLQKVPDGYYVWIGLSQDSWEWSDWSSSWFRKWLSGQPDGRGSCAMTSFADSGRWSDWDCSSALPFVCHGGDVQFNYTPDFPDFLYTHCQILKSVLTECVLVRPGVRSS